MHELRQRGRYVEPVELTCSLPLPGDELCSQRASSTMERTTLAISCGPSSCNSTPAPPIVSGTAPAARDDWQAGLHRLEEGYAVPLVFAETDEHAGSPIGLGELCIRHLAVERTR